MELEDWVEQLKVQAAQHALMLQSMGALSAKVDAMDRKLTAWGGVIAILIPLGNFFAPIIWKALAGVSGPHALLFGRLILS